MSFLLSTCSLISSSVSIITGVRQINAKVAMILQPHKGLRLSDADRRRLVSIHKRIECLIQPLNFCVVWSKDKDSCVQSIIQHALEVVNGVIDFLDKVKFTMDDVEPFTRVLHPESSTRADYFIRELDFACTSVSMAVSVIKGFTYDANSNGRISSYLSPGALLKSSRIINEMCNRSGDLCVVTGQFYCRPSPNTPRWDILGDSNLRVSQFKSVNPGDSPYLIRLGSDASSTGSSRVDMNFPIQAGLSFQVASAAEILLPTDKLDGSNGVVVWTFDESLATPKTRLLHRNPSGENIHDDDLSRLSFDSSDDEALVVHGASGLPSELRARLSATQIVQGPQYYAQYAFLYPLSSSSLSPIDIVYLSRLCVLEASRSPEPTTSPSSPPNQNNCQTCTHLDTSDEILLALLGDTLYIPKPIDPLNTKFPPFEEDQLEEVQLIVETVESSST